MQKETRAREGKQATVGLGPAQESQAEKRYRPKQTSKDLFVGPATSSSEYCCG